MTDQPDQDAAQPAEDPVQPAGDPAPPTPPRRARVGRGLRSGAGRGVPGASVRATDLGIRPADLLTAATAAPGATGEPAGEDAAAARSGAGVGDGLGPTSGPIPLDTAASGACPLLRRLAEDGRLGEAGPTTDAWHRCTAETPPSPLADQQQTLVCLTAAYVDCPRYRRAAAPVPVPNRATVSRVGLSPATLAATVVLLMSFLAALSFVAVNGGIGVPTPMPTDAVAAASQRPSLQPSAAASPDQSPAEASASPLPSTVDDPSPSTEPSVAPSTTPAPSTRPSSTPRPSPTSDRYRLLVACPDRPDCYVYTVRRGDNLTSIGLYFGVPFDTILRLNRWITDPTTIRAGDRIILPPPTR